MDETNRSKVPVYLRDLNDELRKVTVEKWILQKNFQLLAAYSNNQDIIVGEYCKVEQVEA